ncbi:protein midgut expression 1 [Drosophila albomicans]|uniref:Protein midgut expression 1 n=1 Tax=Drosophila albomicans TaxID=7291 RepID=A0A6P8XM07_DROAB|nr:protein midgut expression 1 [Drosophila albomicans]
MCKPIKDAICCCLACGLKILCMILCSVVGVLLVIGLVIYFVFFHNKDTPSLKAADLRDMIYSNRLLNLLQP